MTDRLGVVAGAGPLPGRIVAAAAARGRPVFVLGLEGIADAAAVAGVPQAWVHLGAIGQALRLLAEARVGEVVLAGPVPMPALDRIGLDARGLKMLASLGAGGHVVGGRGADRLLARIVIELEAEGFRVVGLESVLDDVLAPTGPLGRLGPDAAARDDIALGVRTARALGRLDVGQAVVVRRGVVLGVEAAEGTDALLERCARLPRDAGGVLVKVAKPGQERRVDLPAVGPATVEAARAAGLAGIAVEAGATLVLDRRRLAALADEAGLFVVGIAVDPT
ncbi:MAG: LpxI family protein [Alphaproteobacteria bacterium]